MSDAFNIVYSYTRAQAIDDGVLIDATDMAKEAEEPVITIMLPEED